MWSTAKVSESIILMVWSPWEPANAEPSALNDIEMVLLVFSGSWQYSDAVNPCGATDVSSTHDFSGRE